MASDTGAITLNDPTHTSSSQLTTCPENSEVVYAIPISDTSDTDDDVVVISSTDKSEDHLRPKDAVSGTDDQSESQTAPALEFPDGAVRVTYLDDETQSDGTMITFEDLVQPKKLRKAILSAFLVDMDWLKSEIQGHTKIVLVENYNPKAQPRGIMQYDQGMWTIVHPEFHPRQAYPVMHSKLMLLFYDEHVRLVISSANLIPVDWSMIQNILFIQDLPYTAGRPQPSTVFGDSLASALLDLSVPWQAVMPLENIDFSNVTVHLITSVPTSYPRSTDHSKFYGISRLAQIALSMRKRKTDADNTDLNLYVYGTSMSAINEEYLSVFYRCAQGVDPQAMYSTYKWRINKSMVRVYIGFYTESQAREFKHEEAGRGCMMFYRKVFASYSFPKDRMYKITTPLPRVVTHAKVIMARMGRTQSHGWVYLGSHNFTQGAWGRPKGTLRPNINNYELGVIIPDVKYVVEAGTARAMWNGKVVPLSFEVEWQKYSSEDIPCLRG